MGEPRAAEPVMLVVATFSRWPAAMHWARTQLQSCYGPILRQSPLFDFVETAYYEPEMGTGLKKQLLAFQRLIQPTELVPIKLATNRLEARCRREGFEVAGPLTTDWQGPGGGGRPVNLDPGYLAAGKFVLATTKDRSHRVYLGDGIYAEVTLRFERGEFRPWPWTYPDYRRPDYRAFLAAVRGEYLRLLRASRSKTAKGE